MDLIKQLKEEHVEIMRSFKGMSKGVADRTFADSALIDALRELKDVLVSHLNLEDKLLYPALAKSEEQEAKKLGEKFSEEMLGISQVALAFFGKYMSESINNLLDSAEFRKELDVVIKAVTKRVETEEDILYPAYEKCCKQ